MELGSNELLHEKHINFTEIHIIQGLAICFISITRKDFNWNIKTTFFTSLVFFYIIFKALLT